jgi:hypothetical protein
MIALLGVHGANQGRLVHLPGHQRQHLGNLYPRDVGRDWPERAVWLWIPEIDLARAAFEIEQNAGLRLALSAVGWCGLGRTQVPAQAHFEKA